MLTGKCAETLRQLEAEESRRNTAQALPRRNDQTPVQDLVIADLERRKAVGLAKYGTLLQPFNGRDALLDAYQEAMDLTQYLRQALEERSQLATALDALCLTCEARGIDVRVHRALLRAFGGSIERCTIPENRATQAPAGS